MKTIRVTPASPIQFEAKIKGSMLGKGGSYVEFPYNVEDVFKKKGRIKVVCAFDGVEYRGSLVRMGTDCHIVGIRKEILAKIGKVNGDMVHVGITEDLEKRVVTPHEELRKLLAGNEVLKRGFEKLSYTRQKELNDSISSAKKEVTRHGRICRIIMELEGKKECTRS